MSDDPLRARLTALVQEMHDRILPPEIESDTEYWAERIAALLREPPAAAPLDINDLMSAIDALYKHGGDAAESQGR